MRSVLPHDVEHAHGSGGEDRLDAEAEGGDEREDHAQGEMRVSTRGWPIGGQGGTGRAEHDADPGAHGETVAQEDDAEQGADGR